MNKETKKFYSVDDIERDCKEKSHWFDESSMRFFKSKVYPQVRQVGNLVYFISSEKGPSDGSKRLYTIRVYDSETKDIKSYSEFQEYKTLQAAEYQFKKIGE